jgi:lipopolysaccharide biosynthesis protein
VGAAPRGEGAVTAVPASVTSLTPELRPHIDLRAAPGPTGEPVYVADGADPQMIWAPVGSERDLFEHRGAVRVRLRLTLLEGKLLEPCIYVDWGDGYSEETRKALTVDGQGRFGAVADTNAGSLKSIRFDPSTVGCRFTLSDFEVEPAGPVSANFKTISPVRRVLRRTLRRAPARVQGAVRLVQMLLSSEREKRWAARTRISRMIRPTTTNPWREAYDHAFYVTRDMRSPDFAAPPTAPPRRDPEGATVVAFYLPQFHPIPENDRWWGRGFTEWTNVTKAAPQFKGHLQPRYPADLGYYDLRTPGVQQAQAALAQLSGVDAFCFHYYWFDGKRLLERPLDDFAGDATIDMPFAICWANENWTRRWDGQDNAVLIAQRHSPEDDIAVFDDMARYLRNPKYLRVNGRPLLVVYRPDILPDATATVQRWRTRARETGVGELFLLCTDAFGFIDYGHFGFDGLLEFPPHAINPDEINHRFELLNPSHAGRVFDYRTVVDGRIRDLAERQDPRLYPGVMPAWDNEARKPGLGHVFQDATPDDFRRWAQAGLERTRALAPPGERLVFVNAWNEWAEGAYLEPDRWLGHGFAQGLRAAIECTAPQIGADHPLVTASHANARGKDAVALLHLFYPELIEEFATHLQPLSGRLDVAVTFPGTWTAAELRRLAEAMPFARLDPVPNVGRDVAPFIGALKRAAEAGYEVFCKLHSKRSPHHVDGDAWRERLLEGLVGAPTVDQALADFRAQPRLGMLATKGSEMRFGETGVLHHNRGNLDALASQLGFRFDESSSFAAGTMFWGRTAAFRSLVDLPDGALDFGVELGRVDGTLAHALERAMASVALASGHEVRYDL